MFLNIRKHGLKILGIYKQQIVVIGDLEYHCQYRALSLAQSQYTRKKERPHFGDRGSERHSALRIDIPEINGITLVSEALLRKGILIDPGFNGLFVLSRFVHSRKVTLDISHKHGNSRIGKALCQYLQTHGLTGTCSSRDQSVAVSHPDIQFNSLISAHSKENFVISDHISPRII